MVFLCLRALLGMQPDLNTQRLLLDPALPAWLDRIDVRDMRVFDTPISFRVRRGTRNAADRIIGRGRVTRARSASLA